MGVMSKMPMGMRLELAWAVLTGKYHTTNCYYDGSSYPRRIELTSHEYITRRSNA